MTFLFCNKFKKYYLHRGQLSVSVIGASQRFGNPVVSVSNIKYIIMVSFCFLENYSHGKEIRRNFKFTKKKEGFVDVEK